MLRGATTALPAMVYYPVDIDHDHDLAAGNGHSVEMISVASDAATYLGAVALDQAARAALDGATRTEVGYGSMLSCTAVSTATIIDTTAQRDAPSYRITTDFMTHTKD